MASVSRNLLEGDGVLPAPTCAHQELPDEPSLAAEGIELGLVQGRLVLVVLSLVIARGNSVTRGKVHQMISGLVAACTLERERDGVLDPAAHPELPRYGWPNGRAAFQRLGINDQDLAGYWVRARTRAADACLPLHWVLAFCPARLWPAVSTFISWGPERAALMMEEAAIMLAQTPINRATRRRAVGSKLAAGTIQTRINGVWQLIDELVRLRARIAAEIAPPLPLELLASWTYRPGRPDLEACGAKEARLDVAGPPLDECAARLRELAAEAEAALLAHRYFRLRRLLVFAFLALYGIRVDALRRIEVEDFVPDFVFRDGIRGPALRLFPGKTRAADEAHLLPVPVELARRLEEWILYLGHKIGERGLPLFPGTRPRRGELGGFMDSTGMHTFIAGKPNGNGSGSLALLPRNGNRYVGWHPHALRHTAFQGARRAGTLVKANSPHEFATVEPDDFARAVVGHKLIRSPSDRYRDLDQQRLARAAVEEAWLFLWGGGTRRGPDLEAVWRTGTVVREIEAALQGQMRELRRLEDEHQQLLARSKRARGDALHHLTFRSNAVELKSRTLSHEISDLRKKLEAARTEFERARTQEIPQPLDLSEKEYERELRRALGAEPVDADSESTPLADELTVNDVAELFDATVQSINRWHSEGPPRFRPAPWRNDGRAWHHYHKRHKRLRVDAINEDALTPPQQVRLSSIRRRRAAVDVSKQRQPNRNRR